MSAQDRHTESCDLFSVFDQLYPDALSNSGIWLLRLDTDLLKHYSLGVGRPSEWGGLEGSSESTLLVRQIGPFLLPSVVAEFSGCVKTTRLSFTHDVL